MAMMETIKTDFLNIKPLNDYMIGLFGDRKISDLSREETEKLFLVLTKDFYEYRLTLDHHSSYSSWLADNLTEHKDEELDHLLVYASELGYLSRRMGESETAGEELVTYLKILKEYYTRNGESITTKVVI